MGKAQIAILGAGMAGMAASKTLSDLDCTVFEARNQPGGHASSFHTDGFIFDEGPHLSFTPFERIKNFFARSVNNQFYEHPALANNYYQGLSLKHPIQCNLNGLPAALITSCVADFVRAQYEDHREIKTYKDWCYKGLGESISEEFTRKYTHKYWNLELEQLTTDWVSERIYAPKLEEVLSGALTKQTAEHYYMSTFRYPENNGFSDYSTLLAKDSPIQYGSKVVQIDLAHKKLIISDGKTHHFDHLISSLPMPELILLIKDAPPNVRHAARELACTSHFLISIGVNRPHLSDAYWTYYYDEDIPFSRISFPSKYSHKTARPGTSILQLEVVHSRYKALPSRDSLVDQCVDHLLRIGLLHSRKEILSLDARDIKYANVIFDFQRVPNLTIVHDYLKSSGVHWAGRYGEWAYLWTDQSCISGERAANEVRAILGLSARAFDVL
jgi:protoporphyrinogen oxidase